VRAKRTTPPPKEDLSWPEVGELAYGYLRIPLVLLIVEAIYWWGTDTSNSFEPYQAGIASLWTSLSNFIWDGSAVLVRHDTGALTQVHLINTSFVGGYVPVFVSDECVGLHEIIFLSVLMLLTPGIKNRTRWRSIAAMILIVQVLNFIRLVVLYPLAVSGCEASPNTLGCEAPMLEFHQFILSQGFLAILVLMWLGWYIVLDRKGLVDKTVRPSIKDLPRLNEIRLRDSLPNVSKVVIVLCLLLASWATYAVTVDEENLGYKATAGECAWGPVNGWENADGEGCYSEMERWNEAWGRSYRAWIFSAVFIGLAIVTIEPTPSPSSEEE
jgi:exosortase/archaeosortase family protein